MKQIIFFAIDGKVYVVLLKATKIDEQHDISVVDCFE